MTTHKSTRRTLVCSVMAIMLCCVMLIGATWAWFTDTATSGVNKIVAGNLKVGFQYWNGEKYVDAKDVSLFDEDTLWEPGHTEVVYLKVSNLGNLALKYRLSTIDTFENWMARNSDGNEIHLSDYLEIGVAAGVKGGELATRADAVKAAEGNLVPFDSYTQYNKLLPAENGVESADYLAFIVRMPESVGNEANSVNNVAPFIRFNLALSATQVDHESDSFGTDYDEVVPYPIVGADNDGTGTVLYNELRNKTPEILLGADANRYYGWSVISAATLDLNGRKLTADRGYQHVLSVDENGELTLTGNGTVDASTINAGSAVQVADGGKLTIENGTFVGKAGNSCIYDGGGTIVINGGFFRMEGGTKDDAKYILNQNNTTHGTITVTGGTFVNYDPSTGDDNLGGSFVAGGYKVVSETQSNGDVWYTVVAE